MKEQQTAFKRTHFQVIGSTHDYFAENATLLLKEHKQAVVTANEQIKGRGTYNRMWASPPDVNIYATFGVKIPNEFNVYFDLMKSPAIMEIMALAVAKTLEDFGCKPVIKWRNDVLLNGKKISGILCEPIISTQGGVGLIGIGLNVNMSKEICDSLDQPVTSMAVEANQTFDNEDVFNCLANNVAHYIKIYQEGKFSSCVPEINKRLAFIGKLVHVEDHFSKRVIEGICMGIDEIGQLKIKCNDDAIQLVKWGRIIKDELTYPEAFTKKYCEESKPDANGDNNLFYTIGLLSLSALVTYLFYKSPKKDTESLFDAKTLNSKSYSMSTTNNNKQASGKRYFSTYSTQTASNNKINPYLAKIPEKVEKYTPKNFSQKVYAGHLYRQFSMQAKLLPKHLNFCSFNGMKNIKSNNVTKLSPTAIKLLKR